MTIKEFLIQYCEKKGWGISDDDLINTLTACGKIVHRQGRDEHRWYICEQVVTELDGVFIEYTDYVITGDNSMSDMDLKYDLDTAKIVKKKERSIVEVYYE